MWRQDGLCRIQAELGEEALCKTCREYPRLTHDYGDFIEYGLELSCPEAARFILDAEPSPLLQTRVEEEAAAEYDAEAMAVLKATRETVLDLLSDAARPVGYTLALVLLYGCQAQSELDSGEVQPFSPEEALLSARELAAEFSWEKLRGDAIYLDSI
jgi:lysine-N-methylase